MIHLTFSRHKIFFFLLGFVLLWQAIKFISWLQQLKKADIDPGPSPAGNITPVLVSVFYEALCPDSKNFIVRHLLPTVNTASRLINVTLVPYGKAKTEAKSDGSVAFTCQHGPTECLANKIHACGISKVSSSTLLIRYISCMISDNTIPELIGEHCARELGIDWQSVFQCAFSEEGNLLLKKYGEITAALNPKITFVPTVLLENKWNNQAAILKDFFNEVCLMFKELPIECVSL